MSVYVRNRRSSAGLWARLGIVAALAACAVTAAGGGVDNPAGGQCIAHVYGPGCNPDASKINGRCVVMQAEVWVASECLRPKAIPAAIGRAGLVEARPALAGCGLVGLPAVLATIATLESGGDYTAVNGAPGATGRAAGRYQFTTDTWDGYGGYPTADAAPPAVQDAKATEHVTEALGGTGDVSRVPVVWYVGHIPAGGEWDTIPAPGNTTTPRQYQTMWLAAYDRVTAPC